MKQLPGTPSAIKKHWFRVNLRHKIGIALQTVRASGGRLCEAEAPTEPAGENVGACAALYAYGAHPKAPDKSLYAKKAAASAGGGAAVWYIASGSCRGQAFRQGAEQRLDIRNQLREKFLQRREKASLFRADL